MAYLGPPPSQKLATPTSQYFSGNGSATAFTLNRPVNVAEDLNVFVNNVAQQPGSGKSYTATGTTLTFDAAPDAGTNNVYVVYRGLAEPTTRLEHPSGQPLAATTGAFSGNVTMGGTLAVTGVITSSSGFANSASANFTAGSTLIVPTANGIPSWANEITISFYNLSCAGTAANFFTGYASGSAYTTNYEYMAMYSTADLNCHVRLNSQGEVFEETEETYTFTGHSRISPLPEL